MLSVIGQPVPLLVAPQELNTTRPVRIIKENRISFFIFERFNIGYLCDGKSRKRLHNEQPGVLF
jgi:hypothetical protein